ncbi:retinol dehydrogenase 16-like [Numida meleagris]|uniref:retinol dehydrogenase 16-like n=1 Tax=Numida meleagris TaxID=8996 RepID=UPI000B3D869D|nr:retinol dehydrogenase 16-like [Numida meleagris]
MWLWLLVLLGLWLLWRWHRERQTVPGLDEKFVLITGCDSGFGNVLARQLDARGLRVLAGCLTEPGAAQLRAAASSRLQTVLLDVTSSSSIAAAAAWVQERVGERGLWGLVNNAGIAAPAAPNEWLSKDDFVAVLNVNLVGLIEVTLSLLPLVKRARGRVVNVASVMGRLAFFGGGYCPSKFGVEAFSDSLRLEMRHFGVKVSIIEPGYFKTAITNSPIVEKSFISIWERLPDETRASYGENYLQEFLAAMRAMQKKCNPNLSLVTDCMEHALTSCHPRYRYAAGWDAKLLYIPLSYLPSALSDTILSWSYPKPAQSA